MFEPGQVEPGIGLARALESAARALLRMRPSTRELALSGLIALAACADPGPGPDAPDVLLISIDSVRADTLTFLDPETTPHLAALAKRGTVFTQAVSGTSWTLPSHAQMFTGMPPSVHGTQTDDVRIDPATRTLPEALSDGGWHTAGYWTGWYLSSEYGFGRGFDEYHNSMTIDPSSNEELAAALDARGDTPDEKLSLLRQVASHQDITSAQLATSVLEHLDRVSDDQRLFLFCHLFDPHYDYIPPPPHDTRFDPDYTGSIDGHGFWDNRAIYDASKSPPRQISDRDLEHVRALYRGELAWTDAALGRVLERLEREGRLENTLVIVTSDHGEEFFEHGNRGHRNTLYDEVLRVPLLIVPPRSTAAERPRTVDTQVTLSDLMPTVLDYAGLDAPDEVYGRSLRPLVEGGTLPERPALSSLLVRFQTPGVEGYEYMLTQAVRTPTQKFLRTLTFEDGRPRVRRFAQFDLVADPLEQRPRTDASPAEVARLWEAFEDDLDRARRASSGRARSPASERVTTVRETFGGDLQALGYLDGEDAEVPDLPAWLLEPPQRLPLPNRP